VQPSLAVLDRFGARCAEPIISVSIALSEVNNASVVLKGLAANYSSVPYDGVVNFAGLAIDLASSYRLTATVIAVGGVPLTTNVSGVSNVFSIIPGDFVKATFLVQPAGTNRMCYELPCVSRARGSSMCIQQHHTCRFSSTVDVADIAVQVPPW